MYTELRDSILKEYSTKILFFSGPWESDPRNIIQAYGLQLNENYTEMYFQGNISVKIIDFEAEVANGNILISLSEKNKEITGGVIIDNSKIHLTFSASIYIKEKELLPKLYYLCMITIFYLFSIGSLAKHMQKCIESINFAEKTSILTIAMIGIYELGFTL